ncbi:MAG: phosphoglycerate kinase [Anaerovoracaceae bacterium]|jgi:phosphoglycerate kinase
MKKTVRDVDVENKRVFLRCDFNVPLDDNGEITDDRRIRAALPTIKYLMEHNARTIVASHLGRPKGVADMKYSLAPVANRLSELLGTEVIFVSEPEVVGPAVRDAAEALEPGSVMLIENVRFRPEETKNDPKFSAELASLAEIFVNDAFGTAHRAHCSTAGVADFLPAVSGFLLEKEIKFFGGLLENPAKPFTAVLGGSKVADKIPLIENLLDKVDTILIGGGMAYTFLKAQGYEIGTSLLDENSIKLSLDLLKKAEENGVKMLLPVDTICAKEFKNDSPSVCVDVDSMPADMMGLDIGPKTQELYRNVIMSSATVVWNGPAGVFEMDNFASGTRAIAQAMNDTKAVTVIGGGDSAAAVRKFGLEDGISHISTGGGASLEFLEGKKLPGVECLEDK